MYKYKIIYKEVEFEFNVADAGNGIEWAKVRAISHFLYKFPFTNSATGKMSFKQAAQLAIDSGLKITMEKL